VKDFYARPLLKQIFKNGECVYDVPSIEALREYCKLEVDGLWDEVKRFENPHTYYVDMSKRLWELKQKMLEECSL
ncbi:MAG: nicotinate phosphoribosyltransferase, partial [Clostridia bacterium]|nr:nicotinate phosphoribosyltransferase [Clostridia bacterium]